MPENDIACRNRLAIPLRDIVFVAALIVAQVALILGLYFASRHWFKTTRGSHVDWSEIFEWIAVSCFIANASLISLWCGLGATTWGWRLASTHLIFDAIVVGFVLFSQLQGLDGATFIYIMAFPSVFTFVTAVFFRRCGCIFRRPSPNVDDRRQRAGLRFSILDLAGFTFVVAGLIAALMQLRTAGSLDSEAFLIFLGIGASAAGICIAVAFGILGTARILWRALTVPLIGGILYGWYLSTDEGTLILLVLSSCTAIDLETLLLARLFGYRLVIENKHAAS